MNNIHKSLVTLFAIGILCIIIGVSVKVSNDKSSSNEQVAKDTNLITEEEKTSSTTLLRSTNAPSPATPSFETYAGSTVLVSNEEMLESTTNEDEELTLWDLDLKKSTKCFLTRFESIIYTRLNVILLKCKTIYIFVGS